MGLSEILIILLIAVLAVVIPTVVLSVTRLVMRGIRVRQEQMIEEHRRVPCPFCKERIHPDALVCPYCKRDLPQIIDGA